MMLMEDSDLITGLLTVCMVLQAIAIGGIMILLWSVFSRVILREEPTPGHAAAYRHYSDIRSTEAEEAIAKTYKAADPWDELRIDREDLQRVVQTLPDEEGYKE